MAKTVQKTLAPLKYPIQKNWPGNENPSIFTYVWIFLVLFMVLLINSAKSARNKALHFSHCSLLVIKENAEFLDDFLKNEICTPYHNYVVPNKKS